MSGIGFITFCYYFTLSIVTERLPALTDTHFRQEWLRQELPIFVPFEYINEKLPLEANILLLPYENRAYYLERDYFWGHPISQRVIKFEQFNNVTTLANQLKEMGFTHILDNANGWQYDRLRYWEHDRTLMLTLETECGQPIESWDEIRLYKLVACQKSPSLEKIASFFITLSLFPTTTQTYFRHRFHQINPTTAR